MVEMFAKRTGKEKIPDLESEKLAYWKKEKVFEKSVERNKNKKRFVFVEGPPTANGIPHPGHVLTRAHKDLVLRLKTMQGFLVERKGGWDTHGLPVELEVEKALGLRNKKGIEEYGVAKFNEECKKSVFRYEKAWRDMTERVGFWLDMDRPYVTLDRNYIESVWWALKQMWEKNLIYEGYKVVPLCPRCGTPLSSHEVALGYKETSDVTCFVKFKARKEDYHFLAWTTTPWTLFGNVALAVNPGFDYALVEFKGEKLVLASALVEKVLGSSARVLKMMKGKELLNKEYEQLLPQCKTSKKAFFVIPGAFVSLEEGTGIVHQAPAFGEEDYDACLPFKLPVLEPVGEDGRFTAEVHELEGKDVREVSKEVFEILGNKVLRIESYLHDYPHCWRCDTPLIYYARKSWFIKMTALKQPLLNNNAKINWVPENIRDGRFGDFLQNVKDWALSRNRYWGTPLPIWRCEKCNAKECFGSFDELKKRAVSFPAVFDPHKPFVDEIQVKCKCGSLMKRVPEVIDCWFDSGAAPFAQWHYPFENKKKFEAENPADFIVEAIDQTRGWFYTLHAISTVLFNKPAFKNCVVLGHVLDKSGQKMSKSKGNVVDQNVLFEKYGADALRWAFFTGNPPWEPIKFGEEGVKEAYNKFILTLWNSYAYYLTYSETPKKKSEKTIFDEWVLSRLNSTISRALSALDGFQAHEAARAIEDFVLNDLSNWYIRRSRDRFVQGDSAAFATLKECLEKTALLSAPLAPFLSEELWMGLGNAQSVHLQDYPQAEKTNEELEKRMCEVRAVVEAGRRLRSERALKQKQPLAEAIIVLPKKADWGELDELVKGELNVKKLRFEDSIEEFESEPFVFFEFEPQSFVVLNTRLTEELRLEGLHNELSRAIQEARKKAGLNVLQEINCVGVSGVSLVQLDLLALAKEVRAKKVAESAKGKFETEASVSGKKVLITLDF